MDEAELPRRGQSGLLHDWILKSIEMIGEILFCPRLMFEVEAG